MRPSVSVYLALSLDGRIAREDGGLDWLEPFQVEGEDYGYADYAAAIDTVVMGRATFDRCLSFAEWPYPAHEVTVLTHRDLEVVPPRVSSYAGPLLPLLRTLHVAGRRHVYLDGGRAVSQGLEADVVDELILSWIPVVLGAGRPLFRGTLPESRWRLADSRAYPKGLVQCRYERNREFGGGS